jgi:hypothetical protein
MSVLPADDVLFLVVSSSAVPHAPGAASGAALILGPVLRHVGHDTATVWVETDRPCRAEVLGCTERTFEVAGHHYALVRVQGLAPGSVFEYDVRLDGVQAWPLPESDDPPSRIRTLARDRPLRIAFGSCRFTTGRSVDAPQLYGVDALDAYAVRLRGELLRDRTDEWPDLLLMLGDQVYADSTSKATRDRIRERRGLREAPGSQVADFEEYTWLYHESWGDPEIRWLMSTVSTAMIFDDHDVHDDWNTSRAWRQELQESSWWSERIIGALASYWIYQHLGNLSPDELDRDDLYAKVREGASTDAGPGEDLEPVLREFAAAADREADGAKGYRWSFWRDLGRTRLVVLDSRCGRILDGPRRSMLSEAEFAWVTDRTDGDFDHLLLGTSLPWLLSPALHTIEAWSERLCESPDGRRARIGERLRRGLDLEHWAAFHYSFERLADLIADVASGRRAAGAPATVCVLSGDVHHSYVAAAKIKGQAAGGSRVYQITCSPVHNWVPRVMRAGFYASWNPAVEAACRVALETVARVPRPRVRWRRLGRLITGNAIGTLVIDGRSAQLGLESSGASTDGRPTLRRVISTDL